MPERDTVDELREAGRKAQDALRDFVRAASHAKGDQTTEDILRDALRSIRDTVENPEKVNAALDGIQDKVKKFVGSLDETIRKAADESRKDDEGEG